MRIAGSLTGTTYVWNNWNDSVDNIIEKSCESVVSLSLLTKIVFINGQ